MQFDLENDTIKPDDYFSEFSQPVEEFEKPAPTEPEPVPEPEAVPEMADSDAFLDLNQDISGFLTEAADGLMAFVIAWFVAKNAETENYRLPPKELEKIKLLVGKMVPGHKPIMPKWAALLVTVAGAYTPILATAVKDRRIAEQDAEIARLKEELEKKE